MNFTGSEDTKISNVFDKKFKNDKAVATLNALRDILLQSYGPLAGTTIISQNGDVPKITKDGLTILQSIRFNDESMMNIKKLVMTISQSLVQRVGDGSTSSIATAAAILNNFEASSHDLDKVYSIRRNLAVDLDVICEKLINTIRNDFSMPYDTLTADERLEVLTKIAAVSNNNDMQIGTEIAKIMCKLTSESAIGIKAGLGDVTGIKHELKQGFSGHYSKILHKAIVETNSRFENCLIFSTFNFLEVHFNILQNLIDSEMTSASNIIIFAETYSHDVLNKVFELSMRSTEGRRVIPMVCDLQSEESYAEFSDCSVFVDSNPQSMNEINDFKPSRESMTTILGYMGRAKEVIIRPTSGFVVNSGIGHASTTERYTNLTGALQSNLDATPKSQVLERGKLRKRLNRLNGLSCTLYVEAKTEEEKTSLQFLVEDSVEACRSVMNNGYTLGGNVIPMFALFKLLKSDKLTDSQKFLCSLLFSAYIDIASIHKTYFNYNTEAYNVFLDDLYAMEVLSESTSDNTSGDSYVNTDPHVFNIITDEPEYLYSGKCNIIAPVATDIEIIRATFSIIGLLYNSNQLIL